MYMNDTLINDRQNKIKNAEIDPHIDEILDLTGDTFALADVFPLVRASSSTPNVAGSTPDQATDPGSHMGGRQLETFLSFSLLSFV